MSTDTLDLSLSKEEILEWDSWLPDCDLNGTWCRTHERPHKKCFDRALSDAATAKAAWGVNDLLENYDGLTVELEKGFDFAIVLIQDALTAAGIQKPEGD